MTLSDEQYLIQRARVAHEEGDPHSAKAWMITASSLFPENFEIQFEAYLLEKAAQQDGEAARCFDALLQKFSNESQLWKEVQDITTALRTDTLDSTTQFLQNIFNKLPNASQHHLLLWAAEHSEDTMEHCRLLLLLLVKFPETISQHGSTLLDTLMTAEKHSHFPSNSNPFCELLVCELLPILLASKDVTLAPRQLYRLLQRAMEFHISAIFGSSSFQSDTVKSADFSVQDDPWAKLGQIFEDTGKQLGWELSSQITVVSKHEFLLQRISAFCQSKGLRNDVVGGNENAAVKQVLYCTSVLLLRCLYDYANVVEPNEQGRSPLIPSLVLLEAFVTDNSGASEPPPSKKLKHNTDDGKQPHITAGLKGAKHTEFVRFFHTAVHCWQILHSTHILQKDSARLLQVLKADSWSWFRSFTLDVKLYEGKFSEAIKELETGSFPASIQNKMPLKLASLSYAVKDYVTGVQHIVKVMAQLPPVSLITILDQAKTPGGAPAITTVAPGSLLGQSSPVERHLHFLPYTHSHVLHYCVHMTVKTLKKRILIPMISGSGINANSAMIDVALGHLVVLLQLDWPREEETFLNIAKVIRQRGNFTYPYFGRFIINVDMIEEFAHLSNSEGTVLDITPHTSQHWTSQRRISTRGVERGSKEDLRTFLKRQIAKSREPSDSLIITFFAEEGASLVELL